MARYYGILQIALVLMAASFCEGFFFPRPSDQRCRRFPNKEDIGECVICNLFKPKEVTLVVRNVLREPTFEESVTLNCTRFKTLFPMLQEAADVNPAFMFTAKYFGSSLGFFIQAINDVFGTFDVDQSFWQILDGENIPTPVGASTYEPSNGETVTFNLTQSV